MKIDYLWHSEFLVTIKNKEKEDIRILCDSWLSNYAFGDFMERNPMIEIDYSKLPQIDAIFLSHSHCDHVDPYTLINIFKNSKNPPLLLVPITIEFLVPIFKKYLPKVKIQILKNNEVFKLKWINIKWIIFENNYITNEDDVMTLAISNEQELVYTDVDTVPPETYEAVQDLYELFTQKKYKQALYLSTRNELAWNFKILDIKGEKQRKAFEQEYIDYRKEELDYNYSRFDYDLEWASDIQRLPYFMKGLVGQWIIYPTVINPDFQKLKILPLSQEAKIEETIAKNNGRNFPIEWLTPWKSYNIENRKFSLVWDIDFLKNTKYTKLKQDFSIKAKKFEKTWPLNDEKRNTSSQKNIILNLINNRFLPYRLANTEDNLKNAILNSPSNRYIIKVKYWTESDFFEEYYSYDFASTKFNAIKNHNWEFNEDYWANDLEDFYEWKQELYSNFLHKFTPWKTYRLWTCLWANFLNSDLVYKKFEFHFKKAVKWENVDEYVLEKWK